MGDQPQSGIVHHRDEEIYGVHIVHNKDCIQPAKVYAVYEDMYHDVLSALSGC